MPLSWYVQDALIREQLAEAHRRAAHNRLVRDARADRRPFALWSRIVGWVKRHPTPGALLVPNMKERSP